MIRLIRQAMTGHVVVMKDGIAVADVDSDYQALKAEDIRKAAERVAYLRPAEELAKVLDDPKDTA